MANSHKHKRGYNFKSQIEMKKLTLNTTKPANTPDQTIKKYGTTKRTGRLAIRVGVPAHNEEANIGYLLKSILAQKTDLFFLKEIIVISDASTDKTVENVHALMSKKIKIIEHSERKGKLSSLNELFEIFQGDILIQFDADIKLGNLLVVKELIKPFLLNNNVAMVCGSHMPWPPKSFIEKAAFFGVQVWEDAISMLGEYGERYRCTGQIRAFSKDFSKKLRFPLDLGSGEDTFSFYFAKVNNFKVVFAKKALVYHKLSSTLNDYTKQVSRFIYAKNQMNQYFGAKQCKKYETMTLAIRVRALLKNLRKTSPFTVLGFLILHIAPRMTVLTYNHKPVWDMAKSSKNF